MKAPAAHRVGQPAPLAFHLGAAANAYLLAVLAAPNAPEDAFPWHPDLDRFAGPAPEALEVMAEAAARLSAMIEGIGRWQSHPHRPPADAPPAIWQAGSSRLLDYGAEAGARPVVVVPSLINRAHILDLTPKSSFLRALAAGGLRPLLLDWGAPGFEEARFDLTDYMSQRLTPAIAAARAAGGEAPALLGYCMGGSLAASHALADPGLRALVTIGAPWDFHAARGLARELAGAARHYGTERIRAMIRALAGAFGAVPVAMFQQLFGIVDPMQAARKFRRFAAMDQDSAEAAHFVALEDWLADGVPMAGPACETLLVDWHLENATATGRWPPAAPPPRTDLPALIVAGRKDTIAAPGVADALLGLYPDAQHLTPALGHVGMIAGRAAPGQVWQPVVEFLTGDN